MGVDQHKKMARRAVSLSRDTATLIGISVVNIGIETSNPIGQRHAR